MPETDRLRKYQMPAAKRLTRLPEPQFEILSAEVQRLVSAANLCGDCLTYADSWVADLTEFKMKDRPIGGRWAGTPSYRGTPADRKSRRLHPRSCGIQEMNDAFHNELKSWAKDSPLIEYFRRFGRLGKVSIATLKPGGWWPSHYDFGFRHGVKLNLTITSNPHCRTLIWNRPKRRLEKVTMNPGELWFLNVGMRHSAHNFGETERTHVLLTYSDRRILELENFD